MNKQKKAPCPVYYTVKNPSTFCPVSEDFSSEPIEGNVYSVEGRPTSFHGLASIIDHNTGAITMDKITVKSALGFGNNIERAYEALGFWRKLGFRGSPASMASFTREKFNNMKRDKKIFSRCNASANNMLRSHFTGGWIETSVKGHFMEPVYHYDINKAYLHAASKGLPSILYPYDGDPEAIGYIVIMEPNNWHEDLPNFLNPFEGDRDILVTSEDVKRYGLKGDVKWGVQYYDLDVNLLPILDELEKELPYDLWKKCTQTFWGMFASYGGVDIENYSTGSERKLWNRNQNIAWASLIVRRVAGQVFDAWQKYDGISCFVDSVITTKEIDPAFIGNEVGGWKLEAQYDKGIYVQGAGVWHPLPFVNRANFTNRNRWHKHAGYEKKRNRKE